MAQSHTYSISISKHGAAVVDEETRAPITMPQYDALLAMLIARRADHAAECARMGIADGYPPEWADITNEDDQ